MSFLNPAGLWGLLGIPLLILIYIIRPRFQEKLVTSTFIWKLSLKYRKKALPLQWLCSSLLFLVQLLVITAISLVFARPVLVTEDGAAEKIVILDASASMRVQGENGTCFEQAKAAVERLADEMKSYGRMTVIYAGTETRLLILRSGSEKDIRTALAGAEVSYGEADIPAAFALAEEVLAENPGAQILLYTDKEYENPGAVQVVSFSGEAWNAAILSMEDGRSGSREVTFSAKLASYGRDIQATLVLYVDGVLTDAQLVDLPADTPVTVEFECPGIRRYETARLYLEAEDAIVEDNEFYLTGGTEPVYEVLVVSKESAFLEAVLQTFDQLHLTVVSSLDELDLEPEYLENGSVIETIPGSGYDLYVYDEFMPEELPEDGAVWMFYPEDVPEGARFKLGGYVDAGDYLEMAPDSGTGVYQTLTEQVSVEDVFIKEYVEINSALGYEGIYLCDGVPVIYAGEADNVRTVLFAFDLQDSNMALRIAFPELIYNMVEYSLFPVLKEHRYETGDTVELQKGNGVAMVSVSGREEGDAMQNFVRLPAEFPAEAPGLYTVTETMVDGSETESRFFVQLSPAESDMTSPGGMLPELSATAEEVSYEKEITWWIAVVLLVLVVLEWGLQYHGQY